MACLLREQAVFFNPICRLDGFAGMLWQGDKEKVIFFCIPPLTIDRFGANIYVSAIANVRKNE